MPTQGEIARRLGVSRQLVTLALLGHPRVSQKSRQRILDAAQEMGYCPNPHARALQRRRTGIIALCLPNQISTYYNHVACELNRLVRHEGRELIISEMDAAEARQTLSNVPVDGVIAVDIPEQARMHRQMLAARSIPLVNMGAGCSQETDSVQVDLKAGTEQIMAHLLDSGYRRIAHATFMHEGPSHQASRWLGYQDAMQKAGLKPEFIYYPLTKELRSVTRQVIKDYVHQHGRPEAIFCHSDDAAIGMYRGLCDLKFHVPEDVVLAGCDGIEDTEYLECPLTTLVQPVRDMCATAWGFLMNRLEQPALKLQTQMLKPRLVVRESSVRRLAQRIPA